MWIMIEGNPNTSARKAPTLHATKGENHETNDKREKEEKSEEQEDKARRGGEGGKPKPVS